MKLGGPPASLNRVPFSSDPPGAHQTSHTVQSTPSPPFSAMTPEMEAEMRKLIDAAKAAVDDLKKVGKPATPTDAKPPEPPDTIN